MYYLNVVVISFLLFIFYWQGNNRKLSGSDNTNIQTTLIDTSRGAYYFKFDNYVSHLINKQNTDDEKEVSFITKNYSGYRKNFLLALIDKRKGNFFEAYNLLKEYLSSFPPYAKYYEELINAAESSSQIPELQKIISSINVDNTYLSFCQSLINSSLNNYDKALKYTVLAESKLPDDGNIILQKCILLRNMGEYNLAFQELNRLKKIKADDRLIAQIYNLEGTLFYYSGLPEKAYKAYELALQNAKKEDNIKIISKIFTNKAILFDEAGEIDSARKYYRYALSAAKRISDKEAEAFTLSELGVSYTYTNELIEAKNLFIRSYDIYSLLGNKKRLAFLCNNIGKVYSGYCNYKKALEYFTNGIDLAGENKRALIQNYIGTADVYANLSNYSRALEFYNKARTVSEQINEVESQAEIDLGLGILNYNLNQYSNAEKYFLKAEQYAEGINNSFLLANIYDKLGNVCLSQKKMDEAHQYYNKSIGLSIKNKDMYTEIVSTMNLCNLLIDEKQFEKSLALISNSRTSSIKNSLYELIPEQDFINGKIYAAKRNFNKSIGYFKKAAEGGKELKTFDLELESYFEIAKIYESINDLGLAELYYKRSVELLDVVSRQLTNENEVQISYFSGKNEIYNRLAEFYINEGKYEDAFEIIDRARSRNTIQNLNNIAAINLIKNPGELDKLFEYDWLIHSNLNSGNLDSIKSAYSELKRNLIKKEPTLTKYLDDQAHFHLKDLKNSLSSNDYFLMNYTSKDYVILFLVSKDELKTIKLSIPLDTIRAKFNNISVQLNSKIKNKETYLNPDLFSFDAEAAFDIYNLIFKPVFTRIPKNSNVIVSSSTEFAVLPLEFLVTSLKNEGSRFNYKNKSFLISDYNISYIPSASVYINLKQREKGSNGDILLVGNPYINNSQYSIRRGILQENTGLPRSISLYPLKYSEEEINEIQEYLKSDKTLINKEATESNFKANSENCRIIHLSTHSFLLNNQPFIFLAPDKTQDGFLEASEIVQLKLNSDLVVLSSCSSGLGLIDEAEGIVGLSKAFYEAGVKSVVISLWDVNDNYTSKFMGLFYKHLNSGMNKSEALRQAKIEFINTYSANPYYWAAFILSGNINELKLSGKTNYANHIIIVTSLSFVFAVFYLLSKKKKQRL